MTSPCYEQPGNSLLDLVKTGVCRGIHTIVILCGGGGERGAGAGVYILLLFYMMVVGNGANEHPLSMLAANLGKHSMT